MPKPQRVFTFREATGLIVGGVVGAAVAEAPRKEPLTYETPPEWDVPSLLRSAFRAELRKSDRFKVAENTAGDAELRLEVKECLFHPTGLLNFKRLRPVLSVEASVVDHAGRVVWQGRRRIHHASSRTPIVSRDDLLNNAAVPKKSMAHISGLIASDLIRSMTR